MGLRLGILGYPLAHTLSPVLHQAALDRHSLPIRYQAWPTPPEGLGEAVEMLRGDEYLGANVTIPHKERLVPMLDRVDRWAGAIGAVNTIVKEGQMLVGHNTDARGFLRSLREKAGFEPRGKRVVLLGAGGAARAAAFALAWEGVESLTITNRTPARARFLIADLGDAVPRAAAVPMDEAFLREALNDADLVVNSTSVGMSHGEAEGVALLSADLIPSTALVYDMVYTPASTPLMLAAREAGARTLGGLWMLVYQGAAAFELWTGKKAPVKAMHEAAQAQLQARSTA
jgi:shikimate dehydrogenase